MGITHLSGLEVAGLTTMGIGGGLPIAPRYFWVNSVTGSDGHSGTFDNPLATLGQALTRVGVQHKKGDTIVLMPGHAETITGVGGITASTSDVNIIGLGTFNSRPRFLMDGAATVTAAVTGANVTWSNIVFAAGHADIVTCFNITGKGCALQGVEFADNTTAENWLTPIKATGADNTADGLSVVGCRWFSIDAACVEFIEITGNIDSLTVTDNFVCVSGTACPLVLTAGAKVITDGFIARNRSQIANTTGDILIDNGGATNTGLVCDNYIGNLDTTGPQAIGAATGMQFFANFSTSTSTLSGGINPIADTPTT